jgi:hypothetical protein
MIEDILWSDCLVARMPESREWIRECGLLWLRRYLLSNLVERVS